MSAAQGERRPVTVGWKEYLDLPELGISRLKAKIDTGARTSALHVSSLRRLDSFGDGSYEVELTLAHHRLGAGGAATARATVLREIQVTDSGGRRELRPLIETRILLGPVSKPIHLTLTDRTPMLFPMILGRKALEGDFLVDVSRKYIHGRRKSPRPPPHHPPRTEP